MSDQAQAPEARFTPAPPEVYIVGAYKAGKSVEQIAGLFAATPEQVRAILKREGLL